MSGMEDSSGREQGTVNRDRDEEDGGPAGVLDSQRLVSGLDVTQHKPIRSLSISLLQILLFLGNVGVAFAYDLLLHDNEEKYRDGYNNPYSVLAYYHVCMWLVLLVLHVILRRIHRRSLVEGYFTFYRRTREVRGAPLLIASFMNAFLLVLYSFLKDNKEVNEGPSFDYTPLDIVQGVTCLEFIVASIAIFHYARQVWNFNRDAQPPDFEREIGAARNRDSRGSERSFILDIGFRLSFREVDRAAEIIERQNDIIVHLREKLEHVMKLRALSSTLGSAQNQFAVFSHEPPSIA